MRRYKFRFMKIWMKNDMLKFKTLKGGDIDFSQI